MGLPPVDHEQGCQGDPLLVVLDLGQDPDPEQVGRRGLLGERPPEEEGGDHRRREKGEGLGFFGLVERGAREVKSPRAEWWYDASTPVYKNFCGRG